MFPLGTVAFAGVPPTLHVFEPRYRALTRACLDGDRRLGIVLIEWGREAGNGDVRFAVPADAQRVLETDGTDDRLRLLAELLADQVTVLAHLAAGR